MIEPAVFARYMTAIGDRLRFPLTDATNAMYYVTLSGKMTTAEFETAAQHVFESYDEFGFPPASVFLAAMQPVAPVVNAAPLLRQIEKLSAYNPNSGMIAPNVGTVRDALGDLIADAYATAGTARCFSDDDTTRSIAQREFQKAMEKYSAMPHEARPLLESGEQVRKLSARNARPESIADIVKRLPSPTSVSA